MWNENFFMRVKKIHIFFISFNFNCFFLQCKGRSSLIKLIINFTVVGCVCLFVLSQLYKHSSKSESSSSNDEGAPIAKALVDSYREEISKPRPIVLPVIDEDDFHYVEPANSFFRQKHNVLQKRKDWHDFDHIQMEHSRKGPGEQGKAFKLTDPHDIELNTNLLKVNGYYARASDIISVNRSVADIRHPL